MPNVTPAPGQPRRQRRRAPVAVPATAPVSTPLPTAPDPSTLPTAGGLRELGVPAGIVAALATMGITEPFPIQSATLPDSLAGRDILGRGRTGSGKTVAFAVPAVAALSRSGKPRQANRPRALVLVPTRELANQVAAVFGPLAAATGLRVTTVFGGVGQRPQVSALRTGVDLLIACPGRLEDLIGQGHCHLDKVEVTVLDEADHMADLGFLPGVKRLLDRTPAGTQRMLFSATLDGAVDVLVRRYLVDPVTRSVSAAVAPVSATSHQILAVSAAAKSALVRELASGHGRSLLFTRTKRSAKKLAGQLTASGIPAVDLHGNLSQNAREQNLAAFSAGRVRVLVATDIAARGIHVDDIDLVVHVDPPAEHKAYLHRSGRTARAGAAGTVVTVVTPDQHADMRMLAKRAGISARLRPTAPGDAAIVALTGSAAPYVQPAPEAASTPNPRGRRAPVARPARTAGRRGSAVGMSERGPRRSARRRVA